MHKNNNNRHKVNDDKVFRNMFNTLRSLNEGVNQTEPINNGKEIKIPNNDNYMVELKNNISKFVGQVLTDDNSLIIYPDSNDVVFNASITSLNELKFQFRYNDQSGGLYIWADSVLLTKDTADKLSKLVTLREQWYDYWSENIDSYKNKS